jgi:REP element-mobilizing transposase RayT
VAGVSPANQTIAAGTAASTLVLVIKGRPPRLDEIFQSYDAPLFFVTICTLHRHKIENLGVIHNALRQYAVRAANDFNVAVGRYVILPDHIHLFVRGGLDFVLATWVSGLKRTISVALGNQSNAPLWQPGFFDHLLRNDESYSEKWEYVQNNPVRHGLVTSPNEWPYQGEIVYIDRA